MSGKSTGDQLVEHEEYLEDRQLLLFSRQGIYQARVYAGAGKRKYIYRSLKTRNLELARKLATKFFYEIEFRKAEDLPIQQKTFANVLDEYIAMRQQDYEFSQREKVNTSRKQRTSIYMLRQIKRVSKFWVEYCGKKAVDKIDSTVLKDYVLWRRNYYHNKPKEDWPRNARPNPADKTLEWEIIFAKTVLKYAHERGYRGKAQLPIWRFKSEKRIVRPAFTVPEMVKIMREWDKWIYEVPHDSQSARFYHRYMLRNYVDILSQSGIRVGEANNLVNSDVVLFADEKGKNYKLSVKGKTGSRVVIPKRTIARAIEKQRRMNWQLNDLLVKKNNSEGKINRDEDWFFKMFDGGKVKTLIDQFQVYLKYLGIEKNRYGEKYTLYSLRHFYAARMLEKNVPIYDIAQNMGTKVDIIEKYYGRSVTPLNKATVLGG